MGSDRERQVDPVGATGRLRWRPGAWVCAAILALVVVGSADVWVLDVTRGTFGSGYNVAAIRSFGDRAVFGLCGAVFDAALLLLVAAPVLAVLRAVRASPLRQLVFTSGLAVALPLAVDIGLHRLHRILGDILDLDVMLALAGGDPAQAAAQVAEDLPPIALLVVIAAVVIALVWWLTGAPAARLRVRVGAGPSPGWLLAGGLAGVVLAAGLFTLVERRDPPVANELSWKASGALLRASFDRATDFDGDGSSFFSSPPDPDPLDPTRSPGALDLPGNGIDEDGIGGDLPASYRPSTPVPVPAGPVAGERRPWVLMVFLEGFRADVLDSSLAGRPVTPHLLALAARGIAAGNAFVHTPYTWASRAQLFQGRLVPQAGAPTLVDDFKARGYEIAWFSGQHDGLRGGRELLGWDRADVFMDARHDAAERTSRSEQPISLQVPWVTVVDHIESWLGSRHDTRPLFLYVNLVDTHYPYWYAGLQDLLQVGPLPRGHIRPEHREEVWRAYLNAAANVDMAIGRIVTAFEAAAGGPAAVLVTADHGEAFYEHGQLGHGQALDRLQTQVPLIVEGLGGTWPDPVALSDVRGLVLRGLSSPDRSPRIEARPRHRIFQYVGALRNPTLIGVRDASGVLVYEPKTSRSYRIDARDHRRENRPGDDPLTVVHEWEAIRVDAALGDARPSEAAEAEPQDARAPRP